MTSTPITTADIAKGKIDDALSVREKIGYGLGDAGGTVITCLIMNFLTFFYTDVFGLTPAPGSSACCLFLSPTSQAWKTRPPVRLAGSQQWKHCCLRYSTCCWRWRSAFANSITL